MYVPVNLTCEFTVSANVLILQSWTAGKGWFSSLGDGQVAK
jgi:hypothetical protein